MDMGVYRREGEGYTKAKKSSCCYKKIFKCKKLCVNVWEKLTWETIPLLGLYWFNKAMTGKEKSE